MFCIKVNDKFLSFHMDESDCSYFLEEVELSPFNFNYVVFESLLDLLELYDAIIDDKLNHMNTFDLKEKYTVHNMGIFEVGYEFHFRTSKLK